MKSLFVWIGVLVGSVALGVGLYGLVVRPADAAGVSVSSATAQPSPTPTIYKYKTKVVKDPPKRVVVDVPAPAAPATSQPESQYLSTMSDRDSARSSDDDRDSARPSDDGADDQPGEHEEDESGDRDGDD